MNPQRFSGNSDRDRSRRRKLILDAKTVEAKLGAKTRIARELVDPARLLLEPDLQASCFFPYRYMDPYQRTQLFANHLAHIKAIFGKKRGLKLPERGKSIEMEDERTFSALWAARQEFDRHGLDYRKALLWIVKRAYDASHKYLPRPNQLFSAAAIAEAVDMWGKHGWWELSILDAVEPVEPDDPEELDEYGFPEELPPYDPTPALDPRFYAANFVGSGTQNSALDDLEAYVRLGKAGLATARLSLLLHRAKVISHEEAVRRFGQELVDRAHPAPGCVLIPTDVPAHKLSAPVPCLGHGPVHGNLQCATCPASAQCAAMSAAIDADLHAAYGSTDPRAVRKREANLEHQRTSRARKKSDMGGKP